MILENLLSIILIIVILASAYFSVSFLNDMYKKFEHNNFKTQFLNFINLGKYKAFINSGMYTLKFSETGISLVDKNHVVVNRFEFPKNIRMTKFNGLYNRMLYIQRNGLIPRGATFTYKFYGNINEVTIYAVTGKVSYN